MKIAVCSLALALLVACGPPPQNAAPAHVPDDAPAATIGTSAAKAPASGPAPTPATHASPSSEDIWKRISADATACYETGHKVVPEMVDAHIAFVTSVDAAGKTGCVVPSDDSGLTADVEDCMRVRLERESYSGTGAAWSARVPIQVKGGKVSLGGPNPSTSINTIESRGLSEDVYDVVEGLLPDVKECVSGTGRGSGRRVVVVGARVAKDGAVACSVASANMPMAEESRGCLTAVFGRAKFKAPKKGTGLLSVPIELTK